MSEADLPRATVVVPARDAADTIEDCVSSLLALRYPQELLQIVVVDNGSRDATPTVLSRYAGQIDVLEEVRRGRSAARNAGIRHAAGDVVAFTDADCTVDPDWLRELVRPLRDPVVGIVGGAIRAREGANEAELFGERIHDQRAGILVWRPPYAITMSWASRRVVLEESALFDESLRRGEDVDLSYRIGAAGYSLVYCGEAVVYHRNERTLSGLCAEGWKHGFYAADVLARHAEYVAQARDSWTARPGQAPDPVPSSKFSRAFRGGKIAGSAVGRASFAVRRSRPRPGSPG